MNYEIELVRKLHAHAGLPVRENIPAPGTVPEEEIKAMRRSLRTMTDGLIREALEGGNMVVISQATAAAMIATTGPLVALSIPPDINVFVNAVQDLVEYARKIMDDGLRQQSHENIKVGAVMLSTICMGLAAGTSMPYNAVFEEMVTAQIEGRPDHVEEVLIQTGAYIPPAANEEPS